MKVQPLDLARLRVLPLARRQSLSRVEQIMVDPDAPARPCQVQVAAKVRECADRIRQARARGASVMLIYGAHLLRNGAVRILGRMMERGWLTHLATNGAGTIHDWEYAWFGASTESVEMNVASGTFGTWHETASNIHLALMAGALDGLGYGRALGRFICEDGATLPAPDELAAQVASEPAHPLTSARADLLRAMQQQAWSAGRMSVVHRWKQASILARAYRCDVPVTVHPGIGYDIIANHPIFNGAVLAPRGRVGLQAARRLGRWVRRRSCPFGRLGHHGTPGVREEPELCQQPASARGPVRGPGPQHLGRRSPRRRRLGLEPG
jgi:hypothetical protein